MEDDDQATNPAVVMTAPCTLTLRAWSCLKLLLALLLRDTILPSLFVS